MTKGHPGDPADDAQSAELTASPKELPEMISDIELHLEEDLPYAPGPLVGFFAGVLLSVALWLLIGCTVVVVHLLKGLF